MWWMFPTKVTSALMWNPSVVPHCLQDKVHTPSRGLRAPLLPSLGASPRATQHSSHFSEHLSYWTIGSSQTFWAFVYDTFSVWNSILSLWPLQLASGTRLLKGPRTSPVGTQCPSTPFPKHPVFLFITAVLMLHHNCLLVNFPHSFIQALHKYLMNINYMTVTTLGTEDKQWTKKLPAIMELSF